MKKICIVLGAVLITATAKSQINKSEILNEVSNAFKTDSFEALKPILSSRFL